MRKGKIKGESSPVTVIVSHRIHDTDVAFKVTGRLVESPILDSDIGQHEGLHTFTEVVVDKISVPSNEYAHPLVYDWLSEYSVLVEEKAQILIADKFI